MSKEFIAFSTENTCKICNRLYFECLCKKEECGCLLIIAKFALESSDEIVKNDFIMELLKIAHNERYLEDFIKKFADKLK